MPNKVPYIQQAIHGVLCLTHAGWLEPIVRVSGTVQAVLCQLNHLKSGTVWVFTPYGISGMERTFLPESRLLNIYWPTARKHCRNGE